MVKANGKADLLSILGREGLPLRDRGEQQAAHPVVMADGADPVAVFLLEGRELSEIVGERDLLHEGHRQVEVLGDGQGL